MLCCIVGIIIVVASASQEIYQVAVSGNYGCLLAWAAGMLTLSDCWISFRGSCLHDLVGQYTGVLSTW